MKIELKYECDSEDHFELEFLKRLVLTDEAFSALYSIKDYVRTLLKSSDRTPEEYALLEGIQDFIYSELSENSINLDILYT